MNRRNFIGLVVLTGLSRFLPKLPVLPSIPEVAPAPVLPAEALGQQLSYITRRAYLPRAVGQLYNTSSILCGLIEDAKREERLRLDTNRYLTEAAQMLRS